MIEGETKQTTYSDIFSFGKVLYHVIDHGCLGSLESNKQSKLTEFAACCSSPHYTSRPSSKKGLEFLEKYIMPY